MSADKTLKALGLTLTEGPTPEALSVIDTALSDLEPQAKDLKKEEQGVKKRRRELRADWDALVEARALLYTQRPAQPGDVRVGG